jgi:hypothetical protein
MKTSCYIYKGDGEFTNAQEVDLNVRLEAELIDIVNQMLPSLGREVQHYRGMEELPVLTAVPDLLIFQKVVKRPEPDELTGMYTAEMDPKKGPSRISEAEAARQRAVAKARKEQMILTVPRVESPLPEVHSSAPVKSSKACSSKPALPASDASTSDPANEGTRGNPVKGSSPASQASRFTQSPLALLAPHSSDDDDPNGPTFYTSKSTGKSRRNKWHRAIWESDLTAESTAAIPPSAPPVLKAAASPSAPADVPTKEQKAPKRQVKGQESPGTKVSTPTMVTRSQASGAGGLRPVGGSGQTDTRVARRNPSKT